MAGPGGLYSCLFTCLHPSLEHQHHSGGTAEAETGGRRRQEGGRGQERGGDRREGGDWREGRRLEGGAGTDREAGTGRAWRGWEAKNQEGRSQLARIWGDLCGGVWELEHTIVQRRTLWTETQGLVVVVGSGLW